MGAEIELIALQPVTLAEIADGAAVGLETRQSADGAQPQPSGGVRLDAVDRVVGQPVGLGVIAEADVIGSAGRADDVIEASPASAYPHAAPGIDMHGVHRVRAQRARVVPLVHESHDLTRVGIEQVEAAAVGAYPEQTARVFSQRRRAVAPQTLLAGVSQGVTPEAVAGAIEARQAAAVRPHPEIATRVLEEAHDAQRGKRLRNGGIGSVGPERV